jgi:hypothetical protein
MHGDLKKKNFVLKEDDYLNYSSNFKLIDTMVKSIFSTNTVVFIGYGLSSILLHSTTLYIGRRRSG